MIDKQKQQEGGYNKSQIQIQTQIDIEKEKTTHIERLHKKCGCVYMTLETRIWTHLFDVQMCEYHKSNIVDKYER